MMMLESQRLIPVWATIHVLQITDAWMRKKIQIWSIGVVSPLGPLDLWSAPHILKWTQGRSAWCRFHVEWTPPGTHPIDMVNRRRLSPSMWLYDDKAYWGPSDYRNGNLIQASGVGPLGDHRGVGHLGFRLVGPTDQWIQKQSCVT